MQKRRAKERQKRRGEQWKWPMQIMCIRMHAVSSHSLSNKAQRFPSHFEMYLLVQNTRCLFVFCFFQVMACLCMPAVLFENCLLLVIFLCVEGVSLFTFEESDHFHGMPRFANEQHNMITSQNRFSEMFLCACVVFLINVFGELFKKKKRRQINKCQKG